MYKTLIVAALCVAVAFGQGQQRFSASIKVYDDPNTLGVMVGTINYDAAGGLSRVDWQIGGGVVSELIDGNTKLRYLYCSGTCQTETWTTPLPQYHGIGATATGTVASINGVSCTKYNVAGNPVSAVWLSGNTICQADLTTGAKVVFTNVGVLNSNLLSTAGWNCPKQTCNKMIDFALVFDESGSIVASDFAKEKSFAQSFANAYTFGPQDTGMCLIMFALSSRVAIQMSFIKASFVNAVGAVSQRGGSTCIGCGMQSGQNELNARGRRITSVMVVLTDGFNNVNTGQFDSIIATVKNAGTIVFSLGVGPDVNAAELTRAASSIPGVTTAYTKIPDFAGLTQILDQLVQATCINIPGNPCGAGCKGFCSCGASCVCPSACDDRNKCLRGTCTPGVNGNGCVYGPVPCNDGNFCTDDFCDPAIGCSTRTTVCTPSNNCQIPSCNPASGCSYAIRDCEDQNQCTDDTCHPQAPNQGCDHLPIPCDRCFNVTCTPIKCQVNKCDNADGKCKATPLNCDDGNACTDDTCDLATGRCVPTRKSCSDQNACTKDDCNTATGCFNTPFNATDCDDFSACTIDGCNPRTGCTHDNITCYDNITCTADRCDSVLGCVFPPLDCLAIPRIARLLGTCYQALCNESRRGCYLDPLPGAVIDACGVCNGNSACSVVQLPSTVPYVVAGGLLAVVIIGAIIAAIAIVSFAGKKGYDIWLAHKGGMSGAANNPLYNDGGLTGVNPTSTA